MDRLAQSLAAVAPENMMAMPMELLRKLVIAGDMGSQTVLELWSCRMRPSGFEPWYMYAWLVDSKVMPSSFNDMSYLISRLTFRDGLTTAIGA